jgi:hypothetical protein
MRKNEKDEIIRSGLGAVRQVMSWMPRLCSEIEVNQKHAVVVSNLIVLRVDDSN